MFPRCLKFSLFVCLVVCASGVHAAELININTASLEALDSLPGVGPTIAQRIIDGRPYTAVEEIETVQGIGGPGSKTYEDIIGLITISGGTSEPPPEPEEQEVAEIIAPASGSVFVEDTKSISVDAGNDRTVFVGADSVFDALIIGATGEPIENPEVSWSFGNGDRKRGEQVLYHFLYPGEYVVVVDAVSGKYTASDRMLVTAVPAKITVSEVTSEYIALKNQSGMEVDIGGWLLFSLGRQFQFPPHTVIQDGQEVLVSNKRTGLSGSDPATIALQYPNGMVATSYQYPLIIARKNTAGTVAKAPSPPPMKNDGSSTSVIEGQPMPDEASLVSAPLFAGAAAAPVSQGLGIFSWIAGLLVLIIGTSTAVLFIRRREKNTGGYAIEEIENK